MQIVKLEGSKMIFFRDVAFVIAPDDFDNMARMRQERIDTGRFFIPNGEDVVDHFAPAGIVLENGGEVCPIEMGIHVGPITLGNHLLVDLFGQKCFDYAGWKAAS